MRESYKLTKAERTRQMIVKKSAELFNQWGFAGTSMNDIMQVTGLTKGGLYGNFENKDAIAKAAFDYAVAAVGKEVSRRTKVIANSLDKLKAVVFYYKENLFTPAVEGGCPIQNTAIEADDTNPVMREKAIAALDFWQARIIATLEKGKEKKEVRLSVEVAPFASLFISILEGGIMISRLYKDPQHFDHAADQLLKMIEDARF